MLNLAPKRILLIEDNSSVHKEFYKAFETQENDPLLDATKKMLFGNKASTDTATANPSDVKSALQLHSAYRGREAVDMVRKALLSGESYSVVFMDVHMPHGLDAIETAKQLWQVDPDLQIVIFSVQVNFSWEKLAHQLQDSKNHLLVKRPFDPNELRQFAAVLIKKRELKDQVRYQVENVENLENEHHSQMEKITAEMHHQATHDSLTGLPNRILLLDRIQQAMAQAKRYGMHVGILFFDIDNFKHVNDSLGHDVGDQVLKEVSRRLSKVVRESDTLARLSGDEFVAVFVCQPREDHFITIANNFMRQLNQPYKIKDHTIALTASIGISIYPTHGLDVVTLLKNADAALYKAKEEKNTCLIYRGDFNKHILQRMNLAGTLAHAIDRRELVLYYQPIMDLKTEKITCVEALLRWRHPTLGLLSPLEFMSVAEEAGLIVPISHWALQKACSQLKIWMDRGLEPVHISVNISNQQFKKENFVESVEKIIELTKVDPSLLELELKESMLIGKTNEILKKMNELKNMGIHLAIDDFGAGYASLSYLRQFPFEKVKIDRSVIQGMKERPQDAAIVEAIISLSKSMNLQVVAEGVETFGQLDFLRSHASDQVQGYIFHKPLEEGLCRRLLEKRSAGSFVV
jgi:diguanylate cyclase (GGDEF)-like protein